MSKRMLACVSLIGLFSVALAGCGGDDESEDPGPQAQPAQVNEAAATQTAASVRQAMSIARSGDGTAAAFSLASAGSAAFSLVTPGAAAPQAVPGGGIGTAKQKLQTGTCECTETSCTFEACGDDSNPNAWVLDGTISWAGDHLDCDLSITGTSQGFSYTFHEACDLAVSDTSIDGTLDSDGKYDIAQGGQSASFSWDTSIDFDAVTYDAAGCGVSGSIDVDATVTSGGASYHGAGSVDLDGSGC
jgi:hypothetical protein